MTIHHLHGDPSQQQPPPPGRSGRPWTTQDHQVLVDRCRAGASLGELATALERSEGAVVLRAKRLLPLDQRGAPEDRVVPHLHALLTEDAGYDWEHHLAATPPPRPIINHLPAPQVLQGIPGLTDEQLLAVAGLAIRLGVDPLTQELRHDLSVEIESRGLRHRLATSVSRDSAGWLEDFRRESRYLAYPTGGWGKVDVPYYALGDPPDDLGDPPDILGEPFDERWQ